MIHLSLLLFRSVPSRYLKCPSGYFQPSFIKPPPAKKIENSHPLIRYSLLTTTLSPHLPPFHRFIHVTSCSFISCICPPSQNPIHPLLSSLSISVGHLQSQLHRSKNLKSRSDLSRPALSYSLPVLARLLSLISHLVLLIFVPSSCSIKIPSHLVSSRFVTS